METKRPIEKEAQFVDRINQAMQEKGISVAELAKITEINRATIYRYMRGEMEPKSNALYKLGKALDVSEMWIAGYNVIKERKAEQITNELLNDLSERLLFDVDFRNLITELKDAPPERILKYAQLIKLLEDKQ